MFHNLFSSSALSISFSINKIRGNAMRPGWKTTEFWMSTITMFGMMALACFALMQENSNAAAVITGLGAALSSVGYSMSRARVKEASVSSTQEINSHNEE